MRYLNIADHSNRKDQYMIKAATHLQGVEHRIDMKQYFVVHAAHQPKET